MPTRSSRATVRACASSSPRPRWNRIVSAIWGPTFIVGFRDVAGSWKTIPILVLRRCRTSSSESWTIFSPSRRTRPPTTLPRCAGMRPMMDSAVIVLPQPLSPTMPNVSPWFTWKDTPLTGLTTPSREGRCVSRSSTTSTGSASVTQHPPAGRSPRRPSSAPGASVSVGRT